MWCDNTISYPMIFVYKKVGIFVSLWLEEGRPHPAGAIRFASSGPSFALPGAVTFERLEKTRSKAANFELQLMPCQKMEAKKTTAIDESPPPMLLKKGEGRLNLKANLIVTAARPPSVAGSTLGFAPARKNTPQNNLAIKNGNLDWPAILNLDAKIWTQDLRPVGRALIRSDSSLAKRDSSRALRDSSLASKPNQKSVELGRNEKCCDRKGPTWPLVNVKFPEWCFAC